MHYLFLTCFVSNNKCLTIAKTYNKPSICILNWIRRPHNRSKLHPKPSYTLSAGSSLSPAPSLSITWFLFQARNLGNPSSGGNILNRERIMGWKRTCSSCAPQIAGIIKIDSEFDLSFWILLSGLVFLLNTLTPLLASSAGIAFTLYGHNQLYCERA